MYASMSGNAETVKILLKWGADPKLKNNVGYTALVYASERNYNVIVELLKDSMKEISKPTEQTK
jgi:ankyrin repeat protein